MSFAVKDAAIPDPGPTVSVVMAAYNVRPFIERADSDILDQTYPDIELVICEDGSTDGTREWLQGLADTPRVRLFFHETNLGHVANKNFGYAQARGTFITQQDADDVCMPDRIEKQLEAIERSGCRIAACGYYRVSRDGTRMNTISSGTDIVITGKGEEEYPFWFPSLMAHRSVVEEIGPLDPFFTKCFGEDLYWTVRANERYPIICLARPLYGYRDNPGSVTSVLDNPRKLTMTGVLKELLRQRRESGTDPLEQGRLEELRALEDRLAQDRAYMGEQKRIWAARALDERNLRAARRLLGEAWRAWPLNRTWYRTGLYYLRQVLSG